MMKSAILALVALVFTGTVFGQNPNEHLKGYAPFIGTWRYEAADASHQLGVDWAAIGGGRRGKSSRVFRR